MFNLKIIRSADDEDPERYIINDTGLQKAVDMAIWLQKPLLLTGNPGTGKTRLAGKVAYELHAQTQSAGASLAQFFPTPCRYDTKTTSSAADLFYYYDAIGHYRDNAINRGREEEQSDEEKKRSICRHIQVRALGWAILRTYGKKKIASDPNLQFLQGLANFNENYSDATNKKWPYLGDEPGSTVVLIDEIDKASKDFPNDLLNEIENMEFFISELNTKIPRCADSNAGIVVVMTSNFEKNLPDAFLRRCLFYHIEDPDAARLMKIVEARMTPLLMALHKNGNTTNGYEQFLADMKEKIKPMIDKFESLARETTDKRPSTAELLEWIRVLFEQGFFNKEVKLEKLTTEQLDIIYYSLPILTKSKADLEKLRKEVGKQLTEAKSAER